MKTLQGVCFGLLVGVLASLSFSGCASHSSTAALACAQCGCKKMQADAANPDKCKMCGHDAKAHSAEATPSTEGKHVH